MKVEDLKKSILKKMKEEAESRMIDDMEEV
jgi:hypothetical protein